VGFLGLADLAIVEEEERIKLGEEVFLIQGF